MRILVYGAGAVGQAVGAMLAETGEHEVDLIVRERYRRSLGKKGITVTGIFGDHKAEPGTLGLFADTKKLTGRVYDYVLITTKTYDTTAALDTLETFDDQSFIAVSMQNGCGNLEIIADRLGVGRALAARVITGFEIDKPGTVRITVHADDIHIGGPIEGQVSRDAVKLAKALNDVRLPCVATSRIAMDLHAKLLYNCALNPLGAILGVTYGALGANPNAREIMNAVITEVYAVMAALGIETLWPTPEDYCAYFYEKQVPATADHRPSMLQDLKAGKATEIEALTGYVATTGRRHGIPTPVCDTLSNIVRSLQARE